MDQDHRSLGEDAKTYEEASQRGEAEGSAAGIGVHGEEGAEDAACQQKIEQDEAGIDQEGRATERHPDDAIGNILTIGKQGAGQPAPSGRGRATI